MSYPAATITSVDALDDNRQTIPVSVVAVELDPSATNGPIFAIGYKPTQDVPIGLTLSILGGLDDDDDAFAAATTGKKKNNELQGDNKKNKGNSTIIITSIDPAGPFSNSMLRIGMCIIKINNIPIQGMGLQQVNGLLEALQGQVSILADTVSSTSSLFSGPTIVTVHKPIADTQCGISLRKVDTTNNNDIDGTIIISKIHPNGIFGSTSLMVGMKLVSINNISVDGMTTSQAIGLIKVLQGDITITAEHYDRVDNNDNPDIEQGISNKNTSMTTTTDQQNTATTNNNHLPNSSSAERPPHGSIQETQLSLVSIFAIILSTVLGIGAGVATNKANDPYNDDWEASRSRALTLGAVSILLAILATPLQFNAAKQFQKERGSKGKKCLMITSWVIYTIAIFNAIVLFARGTNENGDPIPATLVYGVVFWNVVAFAFMSGHAEAARTK